jgi:hypothetical protein
VDPWLTTQHNAVILAYYIYIEADFREQAPAVLNSFTPTAVLQKYNVGASIIWDIGELFIEDYPFIGLKWRR